MLALVFIGLPFVAANALGKVWLSGTEWSDARNVLKTAALLSAYWGFVRWVERRDVFEFSHVGAARELTLGCALGAALISVAVLLLAGAGWYQVDSLASLGGAMRLLQLHAFVAVLEEVLFRGVLFRLIEKQVGSWWSLTLSTGLFGLAHLANPGANAFTLGGLCVLALCLGLAFLATRRLWLCIGLHWSWNFAQGGLFGLPISGLVVGPGLLSGRTVGPEWATGGAFGLEASAVTLVCTAGVCLFLARVALRRGHVLRAAHYRLR